MACCLLTVTLIQSTIEIKIIKPEQSQKAKEIVLDTALETFQLTTERAEFLQQLDAAGEFYDIEHIEEVYFNNKGLFLVLMDDENLVGTGAIKRLDDSTSELKRMWFLKEYRGKGWGLKMVHQLFAFAKEQGYKKVCLAVWDPQNQQQAVSFYKKNGFYEIAPYKQSPSKLYMEKKL